MSATANRTTIRFKKNRNELIHLNGTKFKIYTCNRLYCLMLPVKKSEDSCQGCYDIYSWHRILGHCNYDDIKKLPNGVKGRKIKEKIGTQDKDCEICLHGIFSQSRNKKLDRRATFIFELAHPDLVGPRDPIDINGHRYAITFTDHFFSAVFVYFLKS